MAIDTSGTPGTVSAGGGTVTNQTRSLNTATNLHPPVDTPAHTLPLSHAGLDRVYVHGSNGRVSGGSALTGVTVQGVGSDTGNPFAFSYGVNVDGNGATITSSGGSVSIIGIGGNGGGSGRNGSHGVQVTGGA